MVFPAQTGDAVPHGPAISRGRVENVNTVVTTGDAPVVLASGQFASDADYRQQGDDLVLTAPDGSSIVVEGYFLLDPPPDLLTPEGGRLTPAMVDSFTPPESAGQYAQAGQLAQSGEPIGQVSDLTGQVFAVRADGTRVQLSAGDAVFQGDVVETAAGGAINMIFVDDTTFALGAEARLALDEMVYNPATQAGSSSFSVLKGVFVFVSGQIAHTDNTQMTVSTPVATIGIRGTKVAGDIRPPGEESRFTVIDGEIAVATQGGSVVMSEANATTSVTSFSAPPSAPVVLSQSEVNQSYGSVREISGGLLNSGPRRGGNDAGPARDAPDETAGDAGADGDDAAGEEGGEAAGQAGAEGEGEGEVAAEAEVEDGDGAEDGEEVAEGDGEEEAGEGEVQQAAAGESEPGTDGSGEGGPDGNGPDSAANDAGSGPDSGGDGFNPNAPAGPAGSGGAVGPGGGLFGGSGDTGFGTGGAILGGGFGPGSGQVGINFGQPAIGPGGENDTPPPVINVDPEPAVPPLVTQSGGAGDDVLVGNSGRDALFGNDGNDSLSAGAGDDQVFGGAGDDILIGGSGAGFDLYDGGTGTDTLVYSSTNLGIQVDTANGTASGSEINTDTFSQIEIIIGGSGDDTFKGGPANFSFDGGSGIDTLDYQGSSSNIVANLGTGNANGADIGTDVFSEFEKVIGGAGDDTLIGDSGANTLSGSGGSDTLDGGGGDDRLSGGAGDDELIGGTGNDTYLGGTGTDTLSFFTLSDGIDLNIGTGTVVDLGGTLGVNGTFSGVESVIGTSFSDTITGSDADDIIDAGGGIDVVQGGAGNDIIGFDASAEFIDGGLGEDRIRLFGSRQVLDSSNLANVTSIEKIDLSGTGVNTFTATESLVQALSGTGTLTVIGDGDDIVENIGNFDLVGPVTLGTQTLDGFANGNTSLDVGVSGFLNSGSINFTAASAFTNVMENQGTLTTDDGTYTNNGLITLGVNGSIDMTGSNTLAGTGTFVNQGSITLQNDTIAGILDGDTGTLGLQDTITIDGTLIMGAATEVDGVGSVILTGAGTLLNQGTHDIDDAPAISVDTIVNQGNFVFSTLTPTITSATIDNQAGALIGFQTDGTVDMSAGQTFSNAGLLQVASSTLDFLDGVIENSGTLDVVSATSTLNVSNATVSMLAGGQLTGAGTVALANSDFDVSAGFTLGAAGAGPDLDMIGGSISGTGSFVNESEIIIDDASSISVATFTNASGGVLDHADGTLSVSSAVFENQFGGVVRVDTQAGTVSSIEFTNNLANAGLMEFFGSNSGVISVGGGSGTLSNTGTGVLSVTDGENVLDANLLNAAGGTVEVNAQGAGIARLTQEAAFSNDGLILLTTGASGTQTASLNQVSGFTLTNTGTIAMNGGIAGDLAELSGDFNNSGTLLVDFAGGSRLVPATGFDAVMVNSGTIDISGASDFTIGVSGAAGNTAFTNTGLIGLAAGGKLTLLQNTLTHTGVLNIGTGASLKIEADSILNLNADFTLNSGATISVGDGTTSPVLGGTATLTSQGLLQLVDGTLSGNLVNDTGAIAIQGANNLNTGVLSFDGDATLGFLSSSDSFSNSNLININNSSTLTVDTGTLHNLSGGVINVFAAGTIDLANGGVFQDDGVTNFGASPGTLTIGGDMLRGDSSFMLFELGGLTPGIHDGFDHLSVRGELAAGGTLDIVEFGSFDVAEGDRFDIIDAGTITNSFREIAGLDVGGGVVLDAVQSATGISLTGRAVTHQGTAGDDTLTGTAGNDVFTGGSGNDFILGNGGADLMHGGDGDDVFVAADSSFGRIDGGAGTDTVRFDSGSFDLTTLRGDMISNIERLDLTAAGNSTLTLDGSFAFAATGGVNALTGAADSLVIDGDSGDTLVLQGELTNTGTVTIGGNGYSVFESSENGAQIFVDSGIAVGMA